MGYNEDDELAINTIRLLAVSLPLPSLIIFFERNLNLPACSAPGSIQEVFKLI